MKTMSNISNKALVFVEPISTIKHAIESVKALGYTPIILFTNYNVHPENKVYELENLRKETIESFKKQYKDIAVILFEPKSFEGLVELLKPYKVCGVFKGSDGGVRLGEKLAVHYNFPSNELNFFD